MAGLDPAIHVAHAQRIARAECGRDPPTDVAGMDARNKSGHDEKGDAGSGHVRFWATAQPSIFEKSATRSNVLRICESISSRLRRSAGSSQLTVT